jgi:hypothetical protein
MPPLSPTYIGLAPLELELWTCKMHFELVQNVNEEISF